MSREDAVYSYEDRIRAVELYVSSGFSPKAVFNALGFPSKNSVKTWYREYLEELHGDDRHDRYRRRETYTPEQKRAAVESYIENGKSRARTVRELGYPGTDTLAKWIDEIAPDTLVRRQGRVAFSLEEKQDAVAALFSREESAETVVASVGVTRAVLYNGPDKRGRRPARRQGCPGGGDQVPQRADPPAQDGT